MTERMVIRRTRTYHCRMNSIVLFEIVRKNIEHGYTLCRYDVMKGNILQYETFSMININLHEVFPLITIDYIMTRNFIPDRLEKKE